MRPGQQADVFGPVAQNHRIDGTAFLAVSQVDARGNIPVLLARFPDRCLHFIAGAKGDMVIDCYFG